MSEIDTFCTGEITCPYCGSEIRDSWDVSRDYGTEECGECEKTFTWVRDISVTYSSWKESQEEPK